MIRFAVLLVFAATAVAQETRNFTDARGQAFTAKLVAADAYRVTIDLPNKGKVTVPQTALSAPDIAFLKQWRQQNPTASLIDPAAMAPWPGQIAAPSVQVRATAATAKSWSWESPYFTFSSDMKLSLGVVRDLALVLEATRELLLQSPIGLTAGGEKARYGVRMFQRPVDYTFNGGLAGSAARASGTDLVILLPELGVKSATNSLTAEHQKGLLTIKHEAAHAVLGAAGLTLPVWLSEGLAECVASWPYAQGRYSLAGVDPAMLDHLAKLRKETEDKKLRLFNPEVVMVLTPDDWQAKVRVGQSFDYYPSVALLTHFFLFHDGKRDSASLAAYIDALRRGGSQDEAVATHLMKGRGMAELTGEFRKLAAKLAPDAVFEDPAKP